MKKLLGHLALTTLVSCSVFNVVACATNNHPNQIYNSVDDAITSLEITSYAQTNESMEQLVPAIRSDIINGLYQSKFSDLVQINYDKLTLVASDIINLQTNLALNDDDMKLVKILSLRVLVNYDGLTSGVKKVTLKIANQSDQAIANYIAKYHFSDLFLSDNFNDNNNFEAVGGKVDNFNEKLTASLLTGLGSFAIAYGLNQNNFTLNDIKTNHHDVLQDDLNHLGNLPLIITGQYHDVMLPDLSLTIKIKAIDLAQLIGTDVFPLTIVPLVAAENLSSLSLAAVQIIYDSVVKNITQTLIAKIQKFTNLNLTINDFKLWGLFEIAADADFSHLVTADFTIQSNNKLLIGIMYQQTIPILVVNI